ncbi:hypothetical protein NP233_g3226 [Leucocoprinus birnbaumii]|uniref:GH18 domain-containing protein n=1 Tax=Leucocoprinus birnbaumii TaxID=56174 RepID=A0AAD5W0R7_9AGAR|nr:hypothetical protein NP233_g3226 [Leucocoprinus birnbaumii]
MKVFFAITTLISLATARPTCPTKPTTAYGASATVTPAANSSTTTTSSTGYSNSTAGNKLATGWYPSWVSDKFAPSQIPWNKYSALTYSFVVTTGDSSFFNLTDDPSTFQEFVSQAHAHNVKALVSVGGWTGSRFFSSSVATPENRTAFASALIDFATKNKLDGIDFDWEHPNTDGMGCNTKSPNDSANFLEFLKEVRQKAPQGFQLTAATAITPFKGPDGNPMSDVSGFAQVLDRIAVMAYDVYGPFSETAGPNAPLQDSCAPTKDQLGSGTSAVKAWTNAGFPANQIALGVPSYGHGFTVASSAIGGDAQKLAEFPAFDKNLVPPGTGETADMKSTDACGAVSGPGGSFMYNDMVNRGMINAQGTSAASGLLYQFDNCSQTAYIYNSTSQVFISYDNTDTYKAKGNFIKEQNLAGFAMWTIDTDTPDGTLADAIRSTM